MEDPPLPLLCHFDRSPDRNRGEAEKSHMLKMASVRRVGGYEISRLRLVRGLGSARDDKSGVEPQPVTKKEPPSARQGGTI